MSVARCPPGHRTGPPSGTAQPRAEQRPDVRRHEAGELEGPVVATLARLVTDRVAVVEDLGALVLELHHRPHVRGHRGLGGLGEPGRVRLALGLPLLERHAHGEVEQRVVRGGLVGDDVDRRVPLEQGRDHLGGVAEHPDRQRPAGVAGLDGQLERVVQRVGLHVEVAVLDASGDPGRVALDADDDAVVHGDRERLGAAHAAEAGGQRDRAGEGAAEGLVGDRGEGLEGALQDALGADVDPGAGGHLAVHRQPEVLQPPELLPVGPVADQVGVRDQHPRRPRVGAHDADRLAGLHEHGLVVLEVAQGAHQGVVRLPAARGLAGAAVHHEVLGALGVLGVEVVHQHPQRRLGLPRLRGQLGAVRGVDGQPGVGRSCEFSDHFFDGVQDGSGADQLDGGLDLGAEVAVGARALDAGGTQQAYDGARWPGTARAVRAGRARGRR